MEASLTSMAGYSDLAMSSMMGGWLGNQVGLRVVVKYRS